MPAVSKRPKKQINFPIADVDEEVRQRFAANVSKHRGCWRWNGFIRAFRDQHYPLMSVQGRQRSVRMVAWVIATGAEVPVNGISTLCGHDWCVAPKHMIPKPNSLAEYNQSRVRR